MRRRRYLSGLLTGTVGGFAGCTADGRGSRNRRRTDSSRHRDSATGPTADVDLPVPESELERSVSKDAIPAIVDPVFGEDWSGVEMTLHDRYGSTYTSRPRLNPSDEVIGVTSDAEARAYPLKVLRYHEVVNDALDGPLLVTYCPLCRSGITAVRRVGGDETVFGVSGHLWRNDLVMYDESTGSLWGQIIATAIHGPQTGERLQVLPSTLTTWEAWQADHPETVVLRPPPESNTVEGRDETREYMKNPYLRYDDSRQVGTGGEFEDDRLHPKALVLGINHGGVARAYPPETVREREVVNDEVGGLPVVVTVTPDGTLVSYKRAVDGETLDFEPIDGAHLRAGGSTWRRATGRAVDGPSRGTILAPANDVSPLFFFAWLEFNQDTTVYVTD